jgi:hypothetical protein
MNAEDRVRVAKELEAIPRGCPAQNMYRSAYEQARYNSFGSRPQIGRSRDDSHAVALGAVREHHPEFTPELW